ncbi:hypothetical protein N7532_010827 [Penicillium argentinense]|uniref:Uncharacterized protein n=1 Tax=Penicillium argentinense TaxID=1131581 RepID=A0A9W9JYH8_9EURO|nr:uncharacterized protein N7532_010827 [Penicillium argentinense]KAJ5086056.1 hypothetical protein N7532_010827 [Penicillium argentinense]
MTDSGRAFSCRPWKGNRNFRELPKISLFREPDVWVEPSKTSGTKGLESSVGDRSKIIRVKHKEQKFEAALMSSTPQDSFASGGSTNDRPYQTFPRKGWKAAKLYEKPSISGDGNGVRDHLGPGHSTNPRIIG